MDLIFEKRKARKEATSKRNDAHRLISTIAAERVAQNLSEFLEKDKRGRKIDIIGGYYPIKTELNLLPVIDRLLKIGKRACLPIIVKKNQPLVFREWDGKSQLDIGKYDVPIPVGSQKVEPDLLICPLLSYDIAGYRLGYGGGFYDRTIASFESKKKSVLVFGCGYSAQFSKRMLPVDQYDRKLDAIITEEGLRFFKQIV